MKSVSFRNDVDLYGNHNLLWRVSSFVYTIGGSGNERLCAVDVIVKVSVFLLTTSKYQKDHIKLIRD